jgi:putative two-component system response regulator
VFDADGAKGANSGGGPSEALVSQYLDRALALRDANTGWHTHRVAVFANAIARKMGLAEPALDAVFFGGTLHDIGKLGCPDTVLHKAGPYTDADRATMRRHCQDGFDILAKDCTLDAAAVALCHHERFDGSGYPRGLAAGEIPLTATICAIADYFDAATSVHGTAPRLGAREAVVEIAGHRGTWFAPDPVDAFVRAYESGLLEMAGPAPPRGPA